MSDDTETPVLDFEKLADSDYLLNVLIQLENILDSLDAYCYFGWLDGEVVEGPNIRRHWVGFTLRYPYRKMPDPRAALRLLKHGIQVEFNSVKQAQAPQPGQPPGKPDPEPDHKTDWLVRITVPRRLLDQMEGADLEMYDDEVNPDDVTAAKDTGLDDESQYHTDEQAPANAEGEMPPGQPPPGGPAGAPF